MLNKIKNRITRLESEIERLEERFNNFEDFDAHDASGGNSEDAYDMGYDHGELYGALTELRALLGDLETEAAE